MAFHPHALTMPRRHTCSTGRSVSGLLPALASCHHAAPAEMTAPPKPSDGHTASSPQPAASATTHACAGVGVTQAHQIGTRGEPVYVGGRTSRQTSRQPSPTFVTLRQLEGAERWVQEEFERRAEPYTWPALLSDKCGFASLVVLTDGTVFAASPSCWIHDAGPTAVGNQARGYSEPARLFRRQPGTAARLVHSVAELAAPVAMHANASTVTVLWTTAPDEPADDPPNMIRQPDEPGPSLLTKFDADGRLLWSRTLELGAGMLAVAADGAIAVGWPLTYLSSSSNSLVVYDASGNPQWTVASKGIESVAEGVDGTWWLLTRSERARAGHGGRDAATPPVEQGIEIRSRAGKLEIERRLCAPPGLYRAQIEPSLHPGDQLRPVRMLAQTTTSMDQEAIDLGASADYGTYAVIEFGRDLASSLRYSLRATLAEFVAQERDATWLALQCVTTSCSVSTCEVGQPGDTVLVRLDLTTNPGG